MSKAKTALQRLKDEGYKSAYGTKTAPAADEMEKKEKRESLSKRIKN